MDRVEALNEILQDLQRSSADIDVCTVFSEDGLPIASLVPMGLGMGEDYIAALSSALLSMWVRASEDFKRGRFEHFVKGESGYTLIMAAGASSALVVISGQDAKLDLVFSEMNQAVERISDVLAA